MKGLLASSLLVVLSASCFGYIAESFHNGNLEPKSREKRQILILCTQEGFQEYPGDATKYVRCILLGGRWYYYVYTCPPVSAFNPDRGLCVVQIPTVPPPAGSTASASGPTTAGSDATTPPAESTTTPAGCEDADSKAKSASGIGGNVAGVAQSISK